MAKKAAKSAAKADPKPVKINPSSKVRTKGEIYNAISVHSCLPRKQVVSVFLGLEALLSATWLRRFP